MFQPARILRCAGFVLAILLSGVPQGDANQGVQIRKIYYSNGAIKGEFYLKDGRLEGPTKWYYPNGGLGAVLHYRTNRLHGPIKTYRDNGELKKVAYYEKGRLVTRWIFGPGGRMDYCEEDLLVKESSG